mmetsp:Transcript_10404/g.47761  ORF Transcript_10404/g.47761 Transcript_10404/m.47761 type:complete len:232 (+) Transcript_10404:792-1487(+)
MCDFASLYPLLGSSTAMYTSVYASMILPMYVPRRSTLMRGFATSSNAGTGSGDALTSSTSLSSAAPTVRSSSAGSLDIAPRSVRCPWYSAMSLRTSATPLIPSSRPASSSAILSASDATRDVRESRADDADGNSPSAAAIAWRQLSRYASFAHLVRCAGGVGAIFGMGVMFGNPALSSRDASMEPVTLSMASALRSQASIHGSSTAVTASSAEFESPETMSARAARSSRMS